MKRILGFSLLTAVLLVGLWQLASGQPLNYLTRTMFTNAKIASKTVEVCASGCRYITIGSALADITDASSTKRYTILVYPGDYDETVTAKSYVTLKGTSTQARLRGVGVGASLTILADVTEVQIEDITIGGNIPIQFSGTNTVRSTARFRGCILGITDGTESAAGKSIDGFLDNGSKHDIWVTNTVFYSQWDCVRVGTNSVYRGAGNVFNVDDQGSNTNVIRIWSAAANGNGAQIYETGSNANVAIAGTTNGISGIEMSAVIGGTATQGSALIFNGVDIRMTNTNASRSAETRCIQLGTTPSNSNLSFFQFIGSSCNLSTNDSGSQVTGLKVVADADHANWRARLIGSKFLITGGASPRDIDNAETNASFTLQLAAMENSGVFNGAGVESAASTYFGSFTQSLIGPTRDLVVGTCTLGETAVDSGGATKEWCVCGTANTWGCWKLTDGTFNAAGPAD